MAFLRRWRGYLLVLGASVTCYAALGAVLRAVPTYVETGLGGGAVAVGLAVGAPSITGAVLRPLGGRWSDRLGARPMVVAGAVAMAVGVLPAWRVSLWALVVSRLVVGAGEAVMMSATVLWLLRIAGEVHQGRTLGHIGLANYAGLTVGPLLVELIGIHHTGRLWVTAMALPLLGAAAAMTATNAPEPTTARHEQVSIAKMVRRTGRPGVGLLLVNIGYVAVLSFGAAVVASHGLRTAALIVPVFASGVIVSRVALGSLPDRLGAARVLAVAAIVEAAGLALFAVATSSSLSVGALVVLSVGQGLAVPSLGVLAVANVPAKERGAASGAFFAWFDAGVGLGGPAVGLVARLSSPQSALIVAAVAVAAVVPVVRSPAVMG
ncbi:MAG TPA: MFS transporter [Mycobacteriales bacterium]|nr:MFS transporter [Mycobacteriales bacterium]